MMGCCGKLDRAKTAVGTVRNIAVGFGKLAIGMKCEFTDARISKCESCDFSIRLRSSKILKCTICGCFVKAKARVTNAKCPRGFWKE